MTDPITSTSGSLALRRLLVGDASQAARLHVRAFPSFFLSTLGERFLKQFYVAFAVREDAVSFVVTQGNDVQGVIVGPLSPDQFFGRLLRTRLVQFAFASVPAVATRPWVIVRLLGALRYRGDTYTASDGALLSSICVDPDRQGKGIGKILLDAWCHEVQARGGVRAYLTTDAENNESVNNFYVRSGWSLSGSFETRQKRVMNHYRIELGASSTAPPGHTTQLGSQRPVYVGFANARLPDTDYRVAYARDSGVFDVHLCLPGRPSTLPETQFLRLPVGEGLSCSTFAQVLRIPAILRRTHADVAHFYSTQFVLMGPILARMAGVRSVVTVTGLGRTFSGVGLSHGILKVAYLLAFRAVARLSDRVLFQNADDMRRLGNAASRRGRHKFHVIGSAIDETVFVLPDIVRDGRPVCLMVARVQEAKGVDDFIELARRLQHCADFVLVGPRSKRAAALDRRLDDAVSAKLIDYLGQVRDFEVRALYAQASVVVLPSRSEGIPRVALEASLARRPVVAYAIPACKAALPAELLVDPFDIDAFVAHTESLLFDARRSAVLADLAYAHVTRRYSSRQYVRELDELLVRYEPR